MVRGDREVRNGSTLKGTWRIKESRTQGVDECVIWQEINRRVSRS